MPNCMVPGCSNNTYRRTHKNISFYRLPKSPSTRNKIWFAACGIGDQTLKDGNSI